MPGAARPSPSHAGAESDPPRRSSSAAASLPGAARPLQPPLAAAGAPCPWRDDEHTPPQAARRRFIHPVMRGSGRVGLRFRLRARPRGQSSGERGRVHDSDELRLPRPLASEHLRPSRVGVPAVSPGELCRCDRTAKNSFVLSLSLSTWPLSNNTELFCRFRWVKPGKSHTTGSLICAKPTRRRDQSTTLHYIKRFTSSTLLQTRFFVHESKSDSEFKQRKVI
jgi:hypothetical protein